MGDQENLLELFPHKEIKFKDKVVAKVRAISIEDYGEVINIIKNLIILTKKGVSHETIVFDMMDDIIKLIPYSVETKLPKIPGDLLPEIIQAMVELNLTKSIVKNWLALFQTIGEKLPEVIGTKEAEQGSGKQ